jgi:phospholipid-binding lipoprotein MlaA
MRQRPMRTWLGIMVRVMATGMAACSGVRRGPAASFTAAFAGHHAGMAAVGAGGDPAAGPSEPMHPDAALEGRLPGGVRLATAHAVAAAAVLTPSSPVNDDEVLAEYDPWEPFNRRVFAFNRQLDRLVLKPVASVWDTVLPDLAQESLGNFFDNLRMPVRLVNHLFQRNIDGAGREFARFFVNLSMGVLGFFDAATELGIATHEADTGQTLGVYGAGPGPYLVLPLFPPLTVRDGMGFAVDSALNPLNYVAPFAAHAGSRGTNLVNDRALNLERFEGVEEATLDLYTAVRNAYLQRRQRAIQERVRQASSALSGGPGRQVAVASDARERTSPQGCVARGPYRERSRAPGWLCRGWAQGGRTQDEAAVDQAFSAALPDVQDCGATRERGSGALAVVNGAVRSPMRTPMRAVSTSPRRMPMSPWRAPQSRRAATQGFHHARGRLWRRWSGTRAAARLWHLVRRMPRHWWPVVRGR